MNNAQKLQKLDEQVINCTRCPRLAVYIRQVAEKKVKRHRHEEYWGRPIPGFGDADPEVQIIGLAPAAHGANRTGRMFTGDSSGDWLYKALHDTGFANKPTAEHKNDGLRLHNLYISALNRCAPPDNKPTVEEMNNCQTYLEAETKMFTKVKVYICLGGLAFNRFCRMKCIKGLKFGHQKLYKLQSGQWLLASYHPSRQNTNTGKLTWPMWLSVFEQARGLLKKNDNAL